MKAIDYAEMPPYDDKWTLTTGSNYPYADANLSAGRLTVFMYPLTNQFSTAQVKTWKRVWLPASTLRITYSWRLKGYLMCGLYLSSTGVDLYLFVEKSINSGTINETILFHRYVDYVLEYQESIDMSPPPASIIISIPEAGYYNIGVGLAGEAGGLLASCAFGGEESEGAWVSMEVELPPATPSTPSGPSSGYRWASLTYTTSTTDPDNDRIQYQFDWGDGSTTWTDYYASEQTASASHSWNNIGSYVVRARAKDTTGLYTAGLQIK